MKYVSVFYYLSVVMDLNKGKVVRMEVCKKNAEMVMKIIKMVLKSHLEAMLEIVHSVYGFLKEL
jgi:hypothetical protein